MLKYEYGNIEDDIALINSKSTLNKVIWVSSCLLYYCHYMLRSILKL